MGGCRKDSYNFMAMENFHLVFIKFIALYRARVSWHWDIQLKEALFSKTREELNWAKKHRSFPAFNSMFSVAPVKTIYVL